MAAVLAVLFLACVYVVYHLCDWFGVRLSVGKPCIRVEDAGKCQWCCTQVYRAATMNSGAPNVCCIMKEMRAIGVCVHCSLVL